jgi:hypothetical protein
MKNRKETGNMKQFPISNKNTTKVTDKPIVKTAKIPYSWVILRGT